MRNRGTESLRYHLVTALGLLAAAVAIYPFDHPVANAVRAFSHAVGREHVIQEVLPFFRPFGKGEVALLIACGLGFCGLRRRAVHIFCSLVIMAVLVWTLKLGVGRERPNRSNEESFPSGDVATAAAVCAPLAYAFPWTAPAGIALTAGVAAGRVYDGKHFPSDVLAGAAFGVLAAGLALMFLRRRPFRPRRKVFLAAGMLVLAYDAVRLPWARALPSGLDFLGIWGPVALLLLAAGAGPALGRLWRRRRGGRPMARPVVLALAVATLLPLYLQLAAASTLWDRDEPRFSRATVEMVQSGDYLVPTFNGALRPDKPILIYWLMSVPVRLLGPSELACRMVAPLAAMLAGLLACWAAGRLAGPAAGPLAFLMVVLSPLMAVSGTAATTDALLLAFITGAVCAFLLSWTRGFRVWHVQLLALALAGALLTKGPVGLAVPLLTIAAVFAFGRGGAVRPAQYLPWLLLAILAGLGFFLAWGLPANTATGGEFLRRGLGHHVVNRSVTPLESHGGRSLLFVLYYVPVLIFAFFPWTLYLPQGLRSSTDAGALAGPVARRTLLCWALPVIVLMSLVATKLPHYVLPAWPAMAIVAAIGFHRARAAKGDASRTAAGRTGLAFFSVVGLVLGLGLIVGPWCIPLAGARIPAVSLGLVFVAMTVLGGRAFVRGRHDAAGVILVAGMGIVLLTAALRLLPALEPFKISPRVVALLNRSVPDRVPVATCGYSEPSLVFYLGRGPVRSVAEADVEAWAADPAEGVLVTTAPVVQRHRTALQPARIRPLAEVKGFNYSQGKWVTVVILMKDPA